MIRAVRSSDLQALEAIFVASFDEEYGRRGVDVAAQVRRWRRIYPLIRLLRTFPNPYRHMLNGFVAEDADGRVAGFILVTPGNAEASRWHIDYVAVHPDAQGQGLGARLVEAVFSRYGRLGVKCFTLEVDALNAPALGLYRKLGFKQYAQNHYYRLERAPAPAGRVVLPPGLSLRPGKASDAEGLFELYTASTPAPVRLVDQRSVKDFELPLVARSMAALREGLGQVAERRWSVVDGRGLLVGQVKLVAQHRALPHTVSTMAHPGHLELHAALLEVAWAELAAGGYAASPVLAWASDYQDAKREALEAAGFEKVTTDCCLARDNAIALKLPAKESLALGEEKAFKPAFSRES